MKKVILLLTALIGISWQSFATTDQQITGTSIYQHLHGDNLKISWIATQGEVTFVYFTDSFPADWSAILYFNSKSYPGMLATLLTIQSQNIGAFDIRSEVNNPPQQLYVYPNPINVTIRLVSIAIVN